MPALLLTAMFLFAYPAAFGPDRNGNKYQALRHWRKQEGFGISEQD
jgi:hypothetical protein